MSDKLTKKQLKEDPLLKTTGETIDFARHHMKLLVGGLGAAVLAVLIVVLVRNAGASAEERAAGAVAEARIDFDRGAYEPAAARLTEVFDKMGGTTGGKRALLLLGDIRYAQERYEEAEAAYQQALDAFKNDPLFSTVALRGKAASLESLGRYDEAAAIYQQLADRAETDSMKFDLLFARATNLLRAGKDDDARTVLEQLAAEKGNPQMVRQARLRLAEMGPATG